MTERVPAGVRAWVARHPYLALFGFALLVRVFCALVIALLLPQLSFFDDGTYSQLARERVNGMSSQWDGYTSWLYTHTATLLYPLTALYKVFGPSKIAGPLLVAVVGAGVGPMVARLLSYLVDRRRALVAGVVVAVLPSQVLVSSVLAKDAFTWFLLASLAVVVATTANSVSPKRVVWLAVLAGVLLALIGYVRLHTMTVAAFALVLSAWFGLRQTRVQRVAGFAAAAIVVPWVIGIGPLGLTLVAHHGSLEGTRAYHAHGGSAVSGLKPKPTASTGSSAGQGELGAGDDQSGAAQSLSYLPRGVSVVLLEPLPWRTDGSKAFRLAAVEEVIWYPLLLLGLVGAVFAWPRRDVLAFPVLSAGALVCMWALVDGNIGTAFRHRGEVVWAVVVLATSAIDRRVRPAGQPDAPGLESEGPYDSPPARLEESLEPS